MELTEQDQATIELIAEKLKQADKLIFEAKQEFYLRFPDDKPDVIQPTAKDEVSATMAYVKIKNTDCSVLTNGNTYPVISQYIDGVEVNNNLGYKHYVYSEYYTYSDQASYQAQQQPNTSPTNTVNKWTQS